MRRAFWENFGENCRRERQKIVPSRSRKTRMKPSKTGKPLPKSQLDFESRLFDHLSTAPHIKLLERAERSGKTLERILGENPQKTP